MKQGIFILFILLGILCQAQNKQDLIVDSLIVEVENAGDKDLSIAQINAEISKIYSVRMPENTDRFLYLQNLLIERVEQHGSKEELAIANYNMGVFHIAALTGFSKSIPPLLRALSLFEETNDSMGVSKSYMQLGLIGYITQYFEDAIKNFNLSLQYAENHTSTYLMAITLTEMGEYEEAKQHFYKAIDAFQKRRHEKRISECYMYLGKLYQDQGMMDSAYYYLTLAIERLTLLQSKIDLGRPYALLSSYYLKANKIDSAKTFALLSLDSLGSSRDELSAMTATGVLSEVYEIEKDYKLAHQFLQRHYELKYENVQGSTKQKIAELQSVFEFQREIAEENLKHQEELRKKNQSRNALILFGLFLLLIAIALWSRLQYVRKAKADLQSEKNISEGLLLNILPEEIAQELKEKGKSEARNFDMVSILFTDFKGFTEQSAKLSASELVSEINHCFEAFDQIIEKHRVEKIKTIGDAYMAAGGLPVPTNDSVKNTLLAALEMQAFIQKRMAEKQAVGEPAFEMRLGIHTGPVVAGIVGLKKFQYDIWGDTVNTASRMESSGEVGKVNISQSTYELLKDDLDFVFESRGQIVVKGKGEMQMYFVLHKNGLSA